MSVTKFDICAQALIMIGAEPITSFDDGTTESTACANLYENVVLDQLSRYRWRFSVGQEQLSRLTDAPSNRWEAAYQLPPLAIQVITVLVSGNPITFDRYQDKIYCDASATDELYLEAVYRIDENFWPPYFVTLLQYQMAALLAESIGAKSELSQLFEQRAARQAAVGRNIDAQGRTAPRIDTTRLINDRFRNQRHYN